VGLVPDRRQVLKEKEEGKEGRQEREKKVVSNLITSLLITLIINYLQLNKMVEIEANSTTPYSILPIKNRKYARDLTEVHLSDRRLTKLE
jgi:hypothetical protein